MRLIHCSYAPFWRNTYESSTISRLKPKSLSDFSDLSNTCLLYTYYLNTEPSVMPENHTLSEEALALNTRVSSTMSNT